VGQKALIEMTVNKNNRWEGYSFIIPQLFSENEFKEISRSIEDPNYQHSAQIK
jgi:hypothetical protein